LEYIDDFNMMGLERHRSLLEQVQLEYEGVLDGKGLPPKLVKSVRPSCEGVEVIGVEVHGEDLTVGVSPAKLQRLAHKTSALLARGHCRGTDLRRLVGHWTWAFLPRRSAFAVFSAVYRYVETAGGRDFTIWRSVAKELRLAMGLVPLLFSPLDAVWFPKTVATDASESGQGVVAASCPSPAMAEMASAPLPLQAGEPVDRSAHPLLGGVDWREIVAAPFRHAEHINVLELRALTTAVRWVFSSPRAIGSRILAWVDSTVVMFAVRKGRSSAYQLLRHLRRLSAFILCSEMMLYCNWIPTEVNPADGPSRRYEFDSTLGFPGEGPRHNFLVRAAHLPKTRKDYEKALRRFLTWADSEGCGLDSVELLDEALAAFFHDLYLAMDGGGRSIGVAAFSGLHLFLPEVKGRLFSSSLALRGWKRLVPPVSHPPLSWDLAVVIAVRLAAVGQWPSGVGVLLAFNCYLRIGELAGLRRRHVALDSDVRFGSAHRGMSLGLRRTKTGPYKWVKVRSPEVQTLVRRLVKAFQATTPAFSPVHLPSTDISSVRVLIWACLDPRSPIRCAPGGQRMTFSRVSL
jgi:hypothetical protein